MGKYTCPECGNAGTCRACKRFATNMAAARTRARNVGAGFRETVKAANAKRVPVARGTRTARTAEKVVRKHVRAESLARIILADDAAGIASDVAMRGHVSADMRDMSPRGARSGNIVPPGDVRVTPGDTAVLSMDAETGDRGARRRLGHERFRMDREVKPGAVKVVNTVTHTNAGYMHVVKAYDVAGVKIPIAPENVTSPIRHTDAPVKRSKAARRRARYAAKDDFAVRLLTGPEKPETAVMSRAVVRADGTTGEVFVPGATSPEVLRKVKYAPDSFNAPIKGSVMHMPDLPTFTCRVCGLEWPEARNAGNNVCMDDAGVSGPVLKTGDIPVINGWKDVIMHGAKIGTVGRGTDIREGEFVAFVGIGMDARYLGFFRSDKVAGDAIAESYLASR